MSDGKNKRDLRLVKPDDNPEPRDLDDATDALRTAVAPPELDAMDHEAILALALGEDVSDISDEERLAADALASALDGRGFGDTSATAGEPAHQLASLAFALKAADAGAGSLASADNDALIAYALDVEAAPEQRRSAEALADALDGQGTHPLVPLSMALRSAGGGELAAEDNTLLLALTVGGVTEANHDADVLREALDGMTAHPLADLAATLRATAGQPTLEAADADILVAMTTGVDLSSADDVAAASKLQHALKQGTDHPMVALTESLRAAAGQLPDLDQLGHERLLRKALDEAVTQTQRHIAARSARTEGGEDMGEQGRRTTARIGGRSGALIGAIVALAAGFALFFGSLKWLETRQGRVAQTTLPSAVNAELITTRSTTELFDPLEKFPTRGGESERLDKILSSRAADLRDNRFSRWGVK